MIWNLKDIKGYKEKAFPVYADPQAARAAVLCVLPEIVYTPFTQVGTCSALCTLLFSRYMSCSILEHFRLWDSFFYLWTEFHHVEALIAA